MSTDTVAVRPAGRWGYLAATSAGRFAVGFQFQALPALAPALAAGVGLGLSEIGTLTGLYMLPGVVVALAGGILLQWLSVRTMLLIGFAVMAAAGVLSFGAEGFAGQAAARLVGGLGGVLATVATLKGLYEWFTAAEMSFANGLSAAAQPLGMGCALLIFPALGSAADWQTGLLSTGGVSAVAFLAVLVLTRPQARETASASPAGSFRFPRSEVLKLALVSIVVALYAGCFYGFLSLFPSYLYARGWAPASVGYLMATLGWAPIVMAPLGGFIATRLRNPVPMIAICFALWGTALIGLVNAGFDPWLMALMLLSGPTPLGAVMSLGAQAVAPERLGIGSGIFMAGLYAGTSAMPAIAGWLGENASWFGGSGEATAILVCGIAFLCALVPLGLFALLKAREA